MCACVRTCVCVRACVSVMQGPTVTSKENIKRRRLLYNACAVAVASGYENNTVCLQIIVDEAAAYTSKSLNIGVAFVN